MRTIEYGHIKPKQIKCNNCHREFFKCHFISWIICLILIGFGLTACENSTATTSNGNNFTVKSTDRMFTKIPSAGNSSFYIVYDNETKVMYAVSDGMYNSGNLTVLVNADGTPKLYEVE